MKTINVTFTDEEYEKLNKKKEESGLGWHDFILKVGESKEENQMKCTGPQKGSKPGWILCPIASRVMPTHRSENYCKNHCPDRKLGNKEVKEQ